jgi:hypothetical protein
MLDLGFNLILVVVSVRLFVGIVFEDESRDVLDENGVFAVIEKGEGNVQTSLLHQFTPEEQEEGNGQEDEGQAEEVEDVQLGCICGCAEVVGGGGGYAEVGRVEEGKVGAVHAVDACDEVVDVEDQKAQHEEGDDHLDEPEVEDDAQRQLVFLLARARLLQRGRVAQGKFLGNHHVVATGTDLFPLSFGLLFRVEVSEEGINVFAAEFVCLEMALGDVEVRGIAVGLVEADVGQLGPSSGGVLHHCVPHLLLRHPILLIASGDCLVSAGAAIDLNGETFLMFICMPRGIF